MLYRIVETFSYRDMEPEQRVKISPFSEEELDIKGHSVLVEELTPENIDVDEIEELYAFNAENENRHNIIGLCEWIIKHLRKEVPQEIVDKIIFNMIDDKGLEWF